MLIGIAGAAAIGGTAMMAWPALAQTRPRYLLATGAAGGSFHEYGPVFAEIVGRRASIDLDIHATAGSNDNIRALAAAEADLGLVSLGPAYGAWNGLGRFAADGPQRGLRALFPMYEAPLALLALPGKGIGNLSDLRGRKVGVGPAGGPADIVFKGLAKALGIEARAVTGAPGDLARKLEAGHLDALWSGSPLPVAAFADVLEKTGGVILGLGGDELAALRAAFPFFTPAAIPAATYRGQSAAVATASVWNFGLCTDRLPDDVAYALTRAALGDAKELAAFVPAAARTKAADAAANTFLTFHPGAARYYREAGVAIPAALAPG
ncbi:TAXI family TRAP transporter solute-binding subunit [Enterovirga rhinocerotis]|nr:TAXI family TRAP transporter solute-binding subunit [Enterovirga rhinocerotis]